MAKSTSKLLSFLIILTCLFFSHVEAQELPDASPWAQVARKIGTTKITITYYSPKVRGRQIWDSLLPYGQEWRTGANDPTTIEFEDRITIGNDTFPAGAYVMTTVPDEKEWKVNLKSTDTLISIMASPTMTDAPKENMEFRIVPQNDSMALVQLEWDKLVLPIEVKVPTIEKTMKALVDRYENWYHMAKSAHFMLQHKQDPEMAMKMAQQSVAKREHFFNTWILAKTYAAQGDYKEASKLTKKALEMGDEKSNFFKNRKPMLETDLKNFNDGKDSPIWY